MGTQAVLAMMRFGAERIDVTRYVTKIGITNHASLSMFEKLGFQEVSVRSMPNCCLFPHYLCYLCQHWDYHNQQQTRSMKLTGILASVYLKSE